MSQKHFLDKVVVHMCKYNFNYIFQLPLKNGTITIPVLNRNYSVHNLFYLRKANLILTQTNQAQKTSLSWLLLNIMLTSKFERKLGHFLTYYERLQTKFLYKITKI
jgi:hypothetical protein